jgi:hypothetical protein
MTGSKHLWRPASQNGEDALPVRMNRPTMVDFAKLGRLGACDKAAPTSVARAHTSVPGTSVEENAGDAGDCSLPF